MPFRTFRFLFFAFSLASGLVAAAVASTQSPVILSPPEVSLQCKQPTYQPPFPASEYFDTPQFAHLSQKRLSGAVQHPTISYDDFGPPGIDSRWETHPPFRRYLQRTYPKVFSSAEVKLVSNHSLLIALDGSSNAKPIVLAAHMDVVGIAKDVSDWEYPPFSGHFDGEWIWGRGSADCKSNVIGLLSVLERLIETGFRPRRTIVLAFGQDEEASGWYGAEQMGKILVKRYGVGGVEMILDEGGSGLDTVYGPLMALPAVAEKGYTDALLTVHAASGHSSVPGKHTAIGLLSHFVSALEDDTVLFRPVITPDHPIYGYAQCIAAHGEPRGVPSWLHETLKSGDMEVLAEKLAEQDPKTRYLLQTSKAATMVYGGIKTNVLPDSATVNINSRIEIKQTAAGHAEALGSFLGAIAEKLNVTLAVSDQLLVEGSEVYSATLSAASASDPSPVTSFNDMVWETFSTAIRSSFGRETIAAPSLMTGNTDTRHYWDVSEHIFRWTPVRSDERLNAHGVNERIKLSAHVQAAKFYHELIMRFDGMTL